MSLDLIVVSESFESQVWYDKGRQSTNGLTGLQFVSIRKYPWQSNLIYSVLELSSQSRELIKSTFLLISSKDVNSKSE